MADTDALLTQLETRVTELERMLKAPLKSKDANRTGLVDTANKVAQDLKKIESQNETIKTFFSTCEYHIIITFNTNITNNIIV